MVATQTASGSRTVAPIAAERLRMFEEARRPKQELPKRKKGASKKKAPKKRGSAP